MFIEQSVVNKMKWCWKGSKTEARLRSHVKDEEDKFNRNTTDYMLDVFGMVDGFPIS